MPCIPNVYFDGQTVKILNSEFEVPQNCKITEYLPAGDGVIYRGVLLIEGEMGEKKTSISYEFEPNPFSYQAELEKARESNWKNILVQLQNLQAI